MGGTLRPVYSWNRTMAASDLLGTVGSSAGSTGPLQHLPCSAAAAAEQLGTLQAASAGACRILLLELGPRPCRRLRRACRLPPR